MMKEVVFGIMAIILIGYLMYFMSPMLITLKDAGMSSVDMNDPQIANYFEMGDGLYAIVGLVGFGVVGFLLYSYATRQDITV